MDDGEDDSDENKGKPASEEFLCEPVQNQTKRQHLDKCSHPEKNEGFDQDLWRIDTIDPVIPEKHHEEDHKTDKAKRDAVAALPFAKVSQPRHVVSVQNVRSARASSSDVQRVKIAVVSQDDEIWAVSSAASAERTRPSAYSLPSHLDTVVGLSSD